LESIAPLYLFTDTNKKLFIVLADVEEGEETEDEEDEAEDWGCWIFKPCEYLVEHVDDVYE